MKSWPQPPKRPPTTFPQEPGDRRGKQPLRAWRMQKGTTSGHIQPRWRVPTEASSGLRLRTQQASWNRGLAGLTVFGRTLSALLLDQTFSRLTRFTLGQRLCVHHEVGGRARSRLCRLRGWRLSFLYKCKTHATGRLLRKPARTAASWTRAQTHTRAVETRRPSGSLHGHTCHLQAPCVPTSDQREPPNLAQPRPSPTEPLLRPAMKTGLWAEGSWVAHLHGLHGDPWGPLSAAEALDLNSTGPERKECEPPRHTQEKWGGPRRTQKWGGGMSH